MNRPDLQSSRGIKITNMSTLMIWLTLTILAGIFTGKYELYLAIYIMSILYSVVNIAYFIVGDLKRVLSHNFFIVGIASGVMIILSVVEFIRLIIGWVEYFEILSTFAILIALFFLLSVVAQSATFFLLAKRDKSTA